MKTLKVGIVISYINILVQTVSGILITPITLKYLGQSEYGLYSLCFSLVSYLGLLNLGMTSSYVKYYSTYKIKKTKKDIDNLNGMYISVFVIIGIIVLVLGFIMSLNSAFFIGMNTGENHKADTIILFLALTLAISMPTSVIYSFIYTQEKFTIVYSIDLITSILTPVLTFIILILGFKSIGITIVALVVMTLKSILCFFYAFFKLHIKVSFKNIQKSIIVEVIKYSCWIFIQSLIDAFNWQIDQIIIGHISGTSSVAVYSIAAKLNTYFITLSGVISAVFTPQAHKILNSLSNDKNISQWFANIGRIQYYIVIYVFSSFIFFGKELVVIWIGTQYTTVYRLTLLLMIPLVPILMQNIGIEILRAKGVYKRRVMLSAFCTIINVILSIPLCYKYNELGCAIATCITMSIDYYLINNIYLYKVGNIDVRKWFKEISKLLLVSIVPFSLGIIFMFNTNNRVDAVIIKILLYTITYILTFYFANIYRRKVLKEKNLFAM